MATPAAAQRRALAAAAAAAAAVLALQAEAGSSGGATGNAAGCSGQGPAAVPVRQWDWSLPAAVFVEQVAAALESARPRLQSLLGTRVRLRNTPVLRFEQDPVRETADRVEQLLRDLRRDRD